MIAAAPLPVRSARLTVREALSALRDPFPMLQRAAALEDVVRLRRTHLINHPQYVERVLVENSRNYRKAFFYRRARPFVGEGLLTSDGEIWERHRRLLRPAFHRDLLATYAECMTRHAKAMLDRWATHAASGEPVDVAESFSRLTLTIAGEALFGADLLGRTGEVGPALTTVLRITANRFFSILLVPGWVPTPGNLRFRKAMRVLEALVTGIIAERRRAAPRSDLLGLLMHPRDAEAGRGLDDHELRDEVMSFVMAAHETTASALAWTFHLLSRAPEADQRLHQEARQVATEGGATLRDLPRLAFGARVAQEALRLFPPIWIFAREAIRPDALGPYRIPAGATVSVCPWSMHRDPRFWEDPERFDPDRFLPERARSRPSLAYVPFSAGLRGCMGQPFATMELQIVIAMVAARYALEPIAGREVVPEPHITLRPRGGLWMRIRERKG